MKKWLRHTKDGFIYEWHPILAARIDMEEVTDEELYPEKYAKPEVVKKMKEIKAKHEKAAKPLDLFTDMIPDEAPYSNDELNEELTERTKKAGK